MTKNTVARECRKYFEQVHGKKWPIVNEQLTEYWSADGGPIVMEQTKSPWTVAVEDTAAALEGSGDELSKREINTMQSSKYVLYFFLLGVAEGWVVDEFFNCTE